MAHSVSPRRRREHDRSEADAEPLDAHPEQRAARKWPSSWITTSSAEGERRRPGRPGELAEGRTDGRIRLTELLRLEELDHRRPGPPRRRGGSPALRHVCSRKVVRVPAVLDGDLGRSVPRCQPSWTTHPVATDSDGGGSCIGARGPSTETCEVEVVQLLGRERGEARVLGGGGRPPCAATVAASEPRGVKVPMQPRSSPATVQRHERAARLGERARLRQRRRRAPTPRCATAWRPGRCRAGAALGRRTERGRAS